MQALSEYSLLSLYLYLTDHCNMNCGHCWISPQFSTEPCRGVPLAVLEKCVREAEPLGLASVKLTGGEPLLYEEIAGLFSFFERNGRIHVYLETNGTLIDDEMVTRFKSAPMAQVSVSLDAAEEEIHDRIRGVKGSFRKVVEGLQLLSGAGLNLQIIMTLQARNRDQIPGLVSMARDLGASSLKINPLMPCGRGIQAFGHGQNLQIEELRRLYAWTEQELSQAGDMEIQFDLPPAFKTIHEIKRTGLGECRILNILGILANGEISMCGIGQAAESLRIGNVQENSISHVWGNSPLLRDLRVSLPGKLKGICGRCIFRFQCLGCCRANGYALSGDLFAPFFLCQELFDAGLFPASRRVD
ncbi:MAG: radical SAM protein [Thermodesulfobacteriota bacterium]